MKKRLLILLLAVIVFVCAAAPVSAYDAQENAGAGVVCAAGGVSLVLKKDGSLWGWGDNSEGQLGNGRKGDKILDKNSIFQTVPVKIMDGVKSVATSGRSVYVVKSDNTLWGWGSNQNAQLGAEVIGGVRLGIRDTPVKIMDGVKAVAAGQECAFAIKTDNTLWGWGSNGGNQMGNCFKGNLLNPNSSGAPQYLQTTPLKLMDHVKMVCSGGYFPYNVTLAIRTDDSLWAWSGGDESVGGLDLEDADGDGNRFTAKVPIRIMDGVASVSAGSQGQVLAVKTDGSLWGWGSNYWGELGNGGAYVRPSGYPVVIDMETGQPKYTIQMAPVKIMDGGVKAVYTGGGSTMYATMSSFSAVLKTDGSLWMCGDAQYGQLLNGAKGNITLQPYLHNYDKVNVICQNTFTKVMDNVTSVSCGDFHTVVAKADGTVWTGGANYWGQLGDGLKTTTKSVDGVTAALSPVKVGITL